MAFQTILAVGAWVFSMVAVSIAICARTKANDNSDWFQHRINRITEKFCEVEKLRSYDKGEFWSLSKRVDDLENQLAEEEDCEPCRPRSYVTLGEGEGKIFVLLPERKKELCKEASKPHKVDEYCVGCTNLIALGGTKPACALDRKCEGYDKKGE